MSNSYLQYPLNDFWISGNRNKVITIAPIAENQDVISFGNGEILRVRASKKGAYLSIKHEVKNVGELLIEIGPLKVTSCTDSNVSAGQCLGKAIGHLEITADKTSHGETYRINPMTSLFIHDNQTCYKSVPYAKPRYRNGES